MNFKYNTDDNSQRYFKRNYVETLNIITPEVYKQEDLALSGTMQSPIDLIIKSHINLARNITSVFNVSNALEGSSFQTVSGVLKYFTKQNGIANITAREFDEYIMYPLGKSISDFKSESLFRSYVSGTLLPNIRLNNPQYLFNQGTGASAHQYLLNNLAWLYVLNTSANGGLAYQPSTLVVDHIVDDIFYGGEITLNESLKSVTKYLWYNYGTCSLFREKELIPSMFLSGTSRATSGTQQLDNLLTLVDVIYSPLISDSKDYRVFDAFNLYLTTSSYNIQTEPAGAFSRFLKSISYSMFDVTDQINKLNYLYDLDKCPEELLPRVAELIGWNLIGSDAAKWRIQLKNAVSIYQLKGTKKGLQAAMNSVFGTDTIDMNSIIDELYESYIPNLIYYLLVTESPLFTNLESWSRQLAAAFGITNYSPDNLDYNIRCVVDKIILDAYKLYPQNFYIGTEPFNPFAKYSYRNQVNQIPPWELVKYYRFCKLDLRLVNFLCQKLDSFGIPVALVESFRYFIESNTYNSNDILASKNNWLIFTRDKYVAPNRDSLLSNYKGDKIKYSPLWNAKSSFFNISLDAGDFEFTKYSKELFSFNGLKSIVNCINDFTPAHAIPLLDLSLTDQDVASYDECTRQYMSYIPSADFLQASSAPIGYSRTGLLMSGLGRVFSRQDVATLDASVYSSGSSISNIPRNSIRRRNFKNNISKTGWYDRTGFNMPGVLLPSSITTTYIPLGYVPSTGKFVSISAYDDIPAVYEYCENRNSQNSYNGIFTSATFPCRGVSAAICENNITYSYRSDCPQIVALMHKKMQERVFAEASAIVTANPPSGLSPFVYNVNRSIANSSSVTQLPTSENDYLDFAFGRSIHQLYYAYIQEFGFHDITRDSVRDRGGKNIFAHTYGPIVYNSYFENTGSATLPYSLLTSSYSNEVKLNLSNGTGLFCASGSLSGTTVHTNTSSLIVEVPEYRNRRVVDGVDFIMPSGSSEQNYFAYSRIDTEFETEDADDFAIDNPLIKIKNKSSPGIPRLKFNLKTYGPDQNVFTPECNFNLQVPYFIGNDSGSKYGGNGIGVWIHTEPEGGYIWSWTPEGVWQIDSVQDVTVQYVQSKLAHTSFMSLKPVDRNTIATPNLFTDKQALLSLKNLQPSLFNTLSVNFDTHNFKITTPDYYVNRTSVHRADQSYSIEVFMFPDSEGQTYAIFDYINAVNLTLNEKTLGFNEEELQDTFLFFRSLALGLGSRVAATTSSLMLDNGGSRLDHIYHPKVGTYTQTSHQAYSLIDIPS